MAAYGYRQISAPQINEMVKRLSRPTQASQTWRCSYDAQQTHVANLQLEDPNFQKNKTVPSRELDCILQRLQKHTQASAASTYQYDNQEVHLMYLRATDPKMQIGESPRGSAGARSRSSGSSMPHYGDRDSVLSGGKSQRSDGRRPPSSSGTVTSRELKSIVDRLTRPTVASRGGEANADKNWEYIPVRRQKTLPHIPGLDTKYLCKNRAMTREEFNAMVGRLTRSTKASQWKTAPNPH